MVAGRSEAMAAPATAVDDSEDGADRASNGVWYLTILIAIGILGSLVLGVSPLIVQGLVQTVHLTLPQAGYCASAETAGLCFGTALALGLGGRLSFRSVVGAGLLLMILGNVLCAVANGFPAFAALRFLTGIGAGLTMVVNGLLAQTARPQRNFAIYNGFNVATFSAAGSVVPWLLGVGGIVGVYIGVALLAAACVVNIGVVPCRTAGGEAGQEAVPAFRAILRDGGLPACAMQFAFAFGLSIVWTYLGEFGSRSGVSEAHVSSAVSVNWLIAGELGCLATGLLDGRTSPRTLVLMSCLGFIAADILFSLGHGLIAFEIGVALFLFNWSVAFPSVMSVVAKLDPSGQLATAAMLVQMAGFSVGPALGAFLLQSGSLQIIGAVSVLGFILTLLAMFLIGGVVPRRASPLIPD